MRISITTLYGLLCRHGCIVTADSGLGRELWAQCEPTEAHWESAYAYKTRPPTKEDAVTYENCRGFTISNLGRRGVWVEMRIWDGDSLYGQRTTRRCVFVFRLRKIGPKLMSIVDRWLTALAEREIQRQDEELYNRRVAEAKENLLP